MSGSTASRGYPYPEDGDLQSEFPAISRQAMEKVDLDVGSALSGLSSASSRIGALEARPPSVRYDTTAGVAVYVHDGTTERLVSYDSGWRDVSADLRLGATGTLHIRREGLTVWWRLRDFTAGEGHAFYWPPDGMMAPSNPISYPPQSTGLDVAFYIDLSGRLCRERTATAPAHGRWWTGSYLLPAGTPPMTTLPGIPT